MGIDHFTRTHNNFNGYSTPSFWLHRTDGTATDFSYIFGVNGQPKGLSRKFYDACRAAVQDDLIATKRRFFNEHGDEHGCVPCEITGTHIGVEDAHLDHAWPTLRPDRCCIPGREIPAGIVTLPADAQTQSVFQAIDVAEAFKAFHHDLAVLRIVQRKANLSMAAGQSFVPSKTSAFVGAGDALGLRGGYSSASIINYRRELEPHRRHCSPSFSV
jgi:hypothetical protein